MSRICVFVGWPLSELVPAPPEFSPAFMPPEFNPPELKPLDPMLLLAPLLKPAVPERVPPPMVRLPNAPYDCDPPLPCVN
jgi:hypothetical protein